MKKLRFVWLGTWSAHSFSRSFTDNVGKAISCCEQVIHVILIISTDDPGDVGQSKNAEEEEEKGTVPETL